MANVGYALGQHVHRHCVAVVVLELVGLVAHAVHLRPNVRWVAYHERADAVGDAVDAGERRGVYQAVRHLALRDEARALGAPDCDRSVACGGGCLDGVLCSAGRGEGGV